MRDGRQFLAAVACSLSAILLFSCITVEKKGEWRWYGADQANTKYAPLDQVDRNNVQRLRIAWRWTSLDEPLRRADPKLWTWMNESTPVMIRGVLYTSTSMSQVAAIESATGTTVWKYDPESYKVGTPSALGFHHRGVAYWESPGERRVFVGTGDGRLIALDARTGQPVHSFRGPVGRSISRKASAVRWIPLFTGSRTADDLPGHHRSRGLHPRRRCIGEVSAPTRDAPW